MFCITAKSSGVEKSTVGVERSHHDVSHEVPEVGLPRPHRGEPPVQRAAELAELLAHLGVHHAGVLAEDGLQLRVRLEVAGHVHSLDINLHWLMSEVEGHFGKLSEICSTL